MRRAWTWLAWFCLAAPLPAAEAPPRSLDPRLTIELFAEQPQIRTPTGLDVDARGRVWVIESNTHFRPDDYDGHPSDRLLILTDADGDGRADEVLTFADGFQFAMSVAVRPVWMAPVCLESRVGSQQQEGRSGAAHKLLTLDPPLVALPTQVFLAERSGIWLLEDDDGDDVCDRRTKLVSLETEGNYPHNGLAGFAFDALGWMYFGLGENLGAPYRLVSRESLEQRNKSQEPGSSGESVQNPGPQPSESGDETRNSGLWTWDSKLSGGGEGGNLYRMWPDGTQLTRWATGFWNPHASCVDAFGRLFTVDNDPDSRPPCRLLHIIAGGDYGYRFRNGRKGLHPFTSWNGEIPGTLPMVAGTGEAPSGILAYEHDAFPEEYLGNLFVTSWGDHRIDRFRLKERKDPLRPRELGRSFESIAEPVVIGGENFRPVGIALAPDGSLYVSDWVLRDYKLHGRGRVWRVRAVDPPRRTVPRLDAASDLPLETYQRMILSASLTERRFAARQLARSAAGQEILDKLQHETWRRPLSQSDVRFLNEILWSGHRRRETPPPAIPFPIHWSLEEKVAWIANVDKLQRSDDPFRNAETVHALSQQDVPYWLLRYWYTLPQEDEAHRTWTRLTAALATRNKYPRSPEMIERLLAEPAPRLRRVGVQWAAEEKLTDLRPQVEAVLRSEPMTTDLFLATLAALELLDGRDPKDFDQTPPGQYVLPLLKDPAAPAAVKAQALRLVDPADEGLTLELLTSLLAEDDAALRLEAIRSLAMSPRPQAVKPLLELVRRRLGRSVAERNAVAEREEREALLGLARHVDVPAVRETLFALSSNDRDFSIDALRALRGLPREEIELHLGPWGTLGEGALELRREVEAQLALIRRLTHPDHAPLNPPQSDRPRDDADWKSRVLSGEAADADAGGRVFFHPQGPRCYQCHTVNGRGGRIGPDLSYIGRAMSREKLLDSILNPSKEVSPQFTTWTFVTVAGEVHTGMIVHENKGETTIGTAEGKLVTLPTIDLETRTPLTTSVMPEKLEERLTVQEFRDLLAFLEGLQ